MFLWNIVDLRPKKSLVHILLQRFKLKFDLTKEINNAYIFTNLIMLRKVFVENFK